MTKITPLYIIQVILGLIASTIVSSTLILFISDIVAVIRRKVKK